MPGSWRVQVKKWTKYISMTPSEKTNKKHSTMILGEKKKKSMTMISSEEVKILYYYDYKWRNKNTELLWLQKKKEEHQRRIQAMEMRCYRKILHISYKNHVPNQEVRAKIQQAIGPHEDLLTIVKRRKLQRYGHVSRSSGLAKTILQGTMKGGRRQGRHRKRWEDNIREWTGLEFGKSQRAVENREKWRKLVAKSSVVLKRPSRLRDWWWWWWA